MKSDDGLEPLSDAAQIVIVGGGPAGLMAADVLARAGFSVTIYDRMGSAGRKLLMAGRGGLNLTHSEALASFMARYGAAASHLKPAIDRFPPEALRAWCEALGQPTFVGSSGRVFPKSLKASPLLRAWLIHLAKLGVSFVFQRRWSGWDEKGRLIFVNPDGREQHVQADAAILALGGASWPRLGSDGGWVDIMARAGIPVMPLRPANCGFVVLWSDLFRSRFEGQPLKNITLSFAGIAVQGEAMISAEGIEGGAIYAISAPLREAIAAHGEATVTIDLRPGLSVGELSRRLQAPRGSQSMSTHLRKAAGLSPLAIALIREATQGESLPLACDAMAALIKALPIRLAAPYSIERAISTAGGIAWSAVDENFMLREKPGVFVAGEMLDWEAPTGGYLLQATFSTAVAAAQGVLAFADSRPGDGAARFAQHKDLERTKI